jgi:hypothetical protein
MNEEMEKHFKHVKKTTGVDPNAHFDKIRE